MDAICSHLWHGYHHISPRALNRESRLAVLEIVTASNKVPNRWIVPRLRNTVSMCRSVHLQGSNTLRKISCPSSSLLMRSLRKTRWRFVAEGSDTMLSTLASDMVTTTIGEKMSWRARTMWRSMTWVTTLATNVFCWTCGFVSVYQPRQV